MLVWFSRPHAGEQLDTFLKIVRNSKEGEMGGTHVTAWCVAKPPPLVAKPATAPPNPQTNDALLANPTSQVKAEVYESAASVSAVVSAGKKIVSVSRMQAPRPRHPK